MLRNEFERRLGPVITYPIAAISSRSLISTLFMSLDAI